MNDLCNQFLFHYLNYYYFICKGRKHTSTSSVSEWTFPDRSSATTRWSDAWQQKQCMSRLKSLQSILNDYINCKLKVKSSILNPEREVQSFLPSRQVTHVYTLLHATITWPWLRSSWALSALWRRKTRSDPHSDCFESSTNVVYFCVSPLCPSF